MSLKIAYVMDPIEAVKYYKDSTFAMMEAAQGRGHRNYYLRPEDLSFEDGQVCAQMQAVRVARQEDFFSLDAPEHFALAEMDAVLMRKDPPFNMAYIYATYLLEQAASETLVLNRPDSLRNANEKLYALNFPDLIPRTLVSSSEAQIRTFVEREGRAILKPIDAMGGEGVFLLRHGDSNLGAILELMTEGGRYPVIVQQYIPAAKEGDVRVLVINGKISSAFRRVPKAGEHRANLAAGGQAAAYELTERDREICAQLAPLLRAHGLVFVGLDLIGGYLIEVNVTSPTGIQEALRLNGVDAAAQLVDWIEANLSESSQEDTHV